MAHEEKENEDDLFKKEVATEIGEYLIFWRVMLSMKDLESM